MASLIKSYLFKFQSRVCVPEIINRVAIQVFCFTFLGVWYVGHFVVFPFHYAEDAKLLAFHQLLGVIFLVEMTINWLGIRYVTSDFNPNHFHDDTPRDITTSSYQQSYWSWKPCLKCNFVRPPRCHHCPLCKKCYLKRDHHCYFAGSCIGFRNQRYFIVFCFWASIAAADAAYHSYAYFANEIWNEMSILDIFAPFSILRWILGYSRWNVAILVCLETFLIYFFFASTYFFLEHYELIKKGLTSFENDKLNTERLQISDPRCFNTKARAVFGNYWGLNFFIPLHFYFEPCDDPANWPNLNIRRIGMKS